MVQEGAEEEEGQAEDLDGKGVLGVARREEWIEEREERWAESREKSDGNLTADHAEYAEADLKLGERKSVRVGKIENPFTKTPFSMG